MAARPVWKGTLKISLVCIPIRVYPATETSDGLTFNQLHEPPCQTRIQQRRWCPTCAREVPSAEIVKGFEFAVGRYVILQPEELEAVAPPSTRVIEIAQVCAAAALDALHVQRSYYLAPDGDQAAHAYAVIRDALDQQVAIGTLAIYGREYLIAVRPCDGILLLHTLHHAAEVRSRDPLAEAFASVPARGKSDEVKLARQVLDRFSGPLDLAAFSDGYRADLQRLIDAKIAGEEFIVTSSPTPTMTNLREALTASLAAVRRDRRSSRNRR